MALVVPPVITPRIIEMPTMNPDGSGTVFEKPRLSSLLSFRFWEPRQSTNRSTNPLARVNAISRSLVNII